MINLKDANFNNVRDPEIEAIIQAWIKENLTDPAEKAAESIANKLGVDVNDVATLFGISKPRTSNDEVK